MRLHWAEYWLVILCIFPLCVGMLAAFFAAKKGEGGHPQFKPKHHSRAMSDALWYGYSKGNFICIISSFILNALTLLAFSAPFGPALASLSIMTVCVTLVSFIAGLVLYLPCAYFGYSFNARKRAEEEIARTQRQILADLKSEGKEVHYE